ncbi:MAG TPA: heavy metal-binding domain-containing protein, partial [Candidatus Obscuribacterales bacterium]|nr:heavy metal-binding domain-containing protein [Candidatus Obscuribacterales bacterium]
MRKSGFALLLAISSVVSILPMSADESNGNPAIAQNTKIAQAAIDSSNTAGGIIVSTTPSLEGYRIREYRGIVRGVMVREPNTIQQFKAGFQGMFGGKVNAYIRNCETGRQGAYDAMVQQALTKGANAIV